MKYKKPVQGSVVAGVLLGWCILNFRNSDVDAFSLAVLRNQSLNLENTELKETRRQKHQHISNIKNVATRFIIMSIFSYSNAEIS